MTRKRITSFVLLLCMLLSMFNLPIVGAASVDTADTGAQTDVAELGATVSENTIIYFDASKYPVSGNVIQFMIGHSSWSQGYPMTKVSNSSLYYVKMPYWDGATQFAIFGCNEEWGGENSSVSSRRAWAPWSTTIMTATNLSGTVILTANSSGVLSKSSSSLNTTHTATAYYRNSDSDSYTKGTTGGTVYVSGYNVSGSSASSKSSSTSGTGISTGITTKVTMKATAKSGYIFQGWYSSTTATSAVSTKTTYTYTNTGSAKTYYARFQMNESYTVTFKDWDGEVLATIAVAHGGAATAPEDPTREGYTFTGWDKTFSNITADTTVTATYSINSYTVTFKDYDGTVLATRTVKYGGAATAPSDPTRSGYEFTGWDKSFSNVTGNLTVTAQYKDVRVWLPGSFNGWDTSATLMSEKSNGTVSVSLKLDPGTYTFKVYTGGVWYGNGGTIEDTTTATSSVGWEMVDGYGDCTLVATGGTYTFTFNKSTRMLVVDYTPTKYTVTFKDYDGTTLSTQSVVIGKAATAPSAPSRAATAQYTYTFSGWDKDFSNVKSNLTVTAQYTSALRKYTVTFEDWDGTVLATRTVEYGSSATPPADPSREGDSQYAYTFSGWSGSYTNITGNTVVKATYTPTTNKYTVTFKDYDGTVLATKTVAHGANAVPPTTPERPGYTFAGWDGSYTNITADTTLVATYTVSVYTITFTDWNGTVLATKTANYGGSVTAPADPTREGHTFAGWDKTFSNITSDLTVNATYTINSYTVTFKDYDGAVLATKTVNYGSAAEAPANPSRVGYKFTGWDKDFSSITTDLTVTAQYSEVEVHLLGDFNGWTSSSGTKMTKSSNGIYTKTLTLNAGSYGFKLFSDDVWYGNNGIIEDTTTATSTVGWEMVDTHGNCILNVSGGSYKFTFNLSTRMLVVDYTPTYYTVTFKNFDGTVLSTQSVAIGKAATAPAAPSRPSTSENSYTFSGWDKDFSNVQSDLTVTALYIAEGRKYTVTFVDWDGTVLATSSVEYGAAATAPSNPTREGYGFAGWDKTFSNITEDTVVTAKYTATYYTVKFVDWDGTVLSTQSVAYGTDATPPADPTRESDGDTTYTFSGWDGSYKNIKAYTVITATYSTEAVYHTVTFVDWNGAVIKEHSVLYGSAAEAPTAPTREGYTFAGWDKSYSKVTSAMTVSATYTINSYTVTFEDYDGTVLATVSVNHGSAAEAPADPTRSGYKFTGWDKDFSNVTADLTVTAQYSEIVINLVGDFNGWSETSGKMTMSSDNVYTTTLNLNADTYKFKIIADGTWYGNDGTIEDTTTATSSVGWEMNENAGDCTLEATGGTYTFTYNASTKMLVITYKTITYTVTFKDWDGTILSSQTVTAGKAAEAPTDLTRVGYKFAGWDKDFSKVTSDITVTAQYSVIAVNLAGDFNNWSSVTEKMSMTYDNVYELSLHLEAGTYAFKVVADNIWYGNAGVIENTTIATSSIGWEMSENEDNCTLEATGGIYTFKYNISTNMLEVLCVSDGYVVTFKDWNGTTLKTQTVEAGTAAEAPEDPTREGHTFAGWDKEFSEVTSNLTVNATYTINSYTVTFKDHDGTVLATESVLYGTAVNAPEAPTREGYVFTGWDTDCSYITGDTTITALYEVYVEIDENVYLAGSFNDWSKNTVMTQSGNHVTVTMELEPGTYLFKIISDDVWYGNDGTMEDTTLTTSSVGWEMTEEAGNCTLLAAGGTYTFNYVPSTRMLEVIGDVAYYNVTFLDYDGTVLETQTVKRGSTAKISADPVRERDEQYTYTFTGWDGDVSNIQADTTVTAVYTQSLNVYKVTFVNDDGTILKTEEVEHGSSATAPEDPTKIGSALCTFTFAGWDYDFSCITADIVITATYTAEGERYTVTFVDWDGTVLSEQSVVYSTSAIAPEVPVREGDEQYSYVFEGWDVDFTYITEPITVTAVYTLTVNNYTVTFVNYDGTVLKTQMVAYGMPAEAPDTPSRPTTAQFRFTFDGWDTDFSFITCDTTVKATYTASVNGSGGSTGIYNLSRQVQRGQILQCWCWSYNNIRANLQDIASQGFSAIQVSPIQPLKESTRNGWNTLMNSSWIVYQPVAFCIETNSFNAQGTKSQFQAMCNEAHKYGIKVIVDVVLNHTANDYGHNSVHPWVPADLRNNPDCWHDISQNISGWNDRYDVTHHCLMSLPDLNTGHPTVQWHCANLLKEAIAAGADGFRFDAAKHIETDWDADGVKSDFWMNVIGEATSYAQSSRGFTPYYYGEVLGAPGGGLGISAYTRYMSITETGSNSIRNAVVNGNAAGAASSGLHTGEGASKAVMYPETHDTYKDDGTRFVSDENINKTWAVIGSRNNVCALYLARPYNPDTTLMGSADKTAWAAPAVKAVNKFKNHFVGQSEYLSSYYNLACVERGDSGIVIVNCGGSYYNGMSAPVHTMKDGTYKDSITGNYFTVSGGWISGDIGDTGIAVVYEAAERGTFTTGNPTDFSIVGTFNDWDAAANRLVANNDQSASTVLYLDEGTYNFKLTTDSDLWFSNAGTITDTTGNSPWSMYANVTDDCTLVASGGKYIFTFNSVSGKLSVEYQATTDYSSNMYLKGTFNDWGTGNRMSYTGKNNIVTTTMTLEPGTYSFKLNDTGYNVWYSNPGTINDTTATGGSSGWDMTIYNTEDCTLVATGGTYTFNLNMSTHKLVVLHKPYTYKVVFKDYDGTVITSQTVERGAAAVAPADPERAFDGTYAYIFAGWDKDFSNITEDTVVTAQYTSAENSYAVIFKDWDGDVVSAQLVEVGAAAVAPEDPFREGNAQFTYEFAGWDKEFSNITADTIVTAQYHVTTNQYTVTFKDWDGTLLGTSTVDYGTSAVAPADPTRERTAQYTYVFSNWSEGFSNVIADVETVAVYEAITNQYTVIFKNWDGSTISTQSVDYGTGAQPPIAPTRDGYLFTGWDADYSYITGDLTVNAKFEEDIVYLKGDFNNWDSSGAMTPSAEASEIVSVTIPIEAGTYAFKLGRVYLWYTNGGTIVDTTTTSSDTGWGMTTEDGTNCTLVASGGYYTFRFNKYTAYLEVFYVPFAYTVTFQDYDGTVLKTEEVERGKAATAPDNPSRDGYAFTGWDVAFDNITANTTVTATYQEAGENEHIVSFVNWDGTPIAQVIVEDGQSAVAPETPTKEGDAQYTYTFSGWDVDITNVTSDLTATATYSKSVNSYTVTFKDWDGTVLSEQAVEYGSAAEAPEAPTREGDENRAYTFSGWDVEFTSITGDLTVNAVYDVEYTKYTVTFVDHDGTVLSTQQVEYSKSAQAPEDPEREGYLFTGWDVDFSNISGELTVTATYAPDIVYLRGDFNNWSTDNAMTETETAGVVSVVLNLEAGKYTFKINRVNDWYSNSGTIEDTTLATSENGWGMSASESGNCTLNATGGYYEFRFNKNTAYLEVLKADSYRTVTFVNWDGALIEEQIVANGSAAVAPQAPTREGDAQYSYTFNGWDVDFSSVTADMTVTATYTQTVNSYKVTFVNYDGTVLSEQLVEYGSAAVAPEAPTREGDEYSSYTFTGWDVEFTNITGELTVTALYDEELAEHTVTFKNWDGTVLSTQQVKHGKSAQAPADPEKSGYTFAGWDKDFTSITADTTITATFAEDIAYLTGSFNQWTQDTALSATESDNVVSVTMELPAGTYEFQILYLNKWLGNAGTIQDTTTTTSDIGWEMTEGAGNCTLKVSGGEYTFTFNKATRMLEIEYTPIEFVVIFLDFDGEIISEQMVCLGADAVEPEAPEVEGYTFVGWDGEFTNVESDTPVFALYEEGIVDFTVTFVDFDGTVLSEQQIIYGKSATAPEDPARDGYVFTGWDAEFTKITEDITITAQYAEDIAYLCGSFNDWSDNLTLSATETDDVVSVTVELAEGTYAFQIKYLGKWLGNTGVIEDTTQISTEFGWVMTESAGDCTLNATGGTYTFNFNKAASSLEVVHTPVKYTVTFVDWNGTVLKTASVEKGSAAEAPADPTRDGYTFAGWDKAFDNITGDLTVTATYTLAPRLDCMVRFVDWDGTVISQGLVTYGEDATAPEAPEREGYIFTGWDKEFTNIQGDTTVTAQYIADVVYLPGSFNEWSADAAMSATETDDVVSVTVDLEEGRYEFQILYLDKWYGNTGTIEDTTITSSDIGWKMLEGAGNCVINATGGLYTFNFNKETKMLEVVRTPIEYTVTFQDFDGTILKTEVVERGKNATAPEEPTREDYMFSGWSTSYSNVKADTVVVATYLMLEVTYTVTFLDHDGTILKTEIVKTGEDATAPEDPTREGFKFIGWNKDFTGITYNLYVHALYEDERVFLTGSFTDWLNTTEMTKTETENVYSVELLLEEGKHHFKVFHKDVWFGNAGEIEDTTISTSEVGWEMIDGEGDCALIASGGKYTFNFNLDTKFLEILYTPVEYTVTFVGFEGQVLSEQKVGYGAAAEAPEAPAVEGYNFIEWDTEFIHIEADTTVTAVYAAEDAEFTVTFVDYDGTELSTQQVGYGKFATPPAAPTRDGYAFIGWDKNFTEVTSDLVVTAKYMATTVYLSGEFNDWNEEVAMVPGDSSEIVTYELTVPKGEYEFKIIAYDTWYGNEGVIEDTTVTSSEIGWAMLGYAGNCTLKASGGTYTFNFNIYTAMLEVLYTPVEYNVTFAGFEGAELSKQAVKYGDAASAPEAPEVEGYVFSGWDKDFSKIEADTVVNAVYLADDNKFTVTFVDHDGTVISTQEVECGEAAVAPEDPERIGYIFTGWDKKFDKITANTTVVAQYKDNQIYLAGSFNDWNKRFYLEREGDSSVFSAQIVFLEGTHYFKLVQNDVWYSNASTVIDTTDVTSKAGIELRPDNDLGEIILNASGGTYTFKFDTLTDRLIVLYSEEIISYNVTFVDFNGTVLSEQEVYINNSAIAPEAPTREGTEFYSYTFNGWDKDFSRVSSDMTVTATYLMTFNTYTVTFVDEEGNVLGTSEVEHGSAATAPEVPAKEGYIFIGWDTDFSNVVGDLTVTAEFIEEGEGVASNVSLAGSFNGWNSASDYFIETSDDDIVVVKMNLDPATYEFKIVVDGNWYGCDTTIVNSTAGASCVMSNSAGNCKLAASGGTYTFTYYKSTNKLVVNHEGGSGEEIVLYTVIFVDTDGTIIDKQSVLPGGTAAAPAVPEKDGYVFAGWDRDFTNVTEDIIVTAKYTEGSYSSVSIAGDFNGWNSSANYFIKKTGSKLVTLELTIERGTYKFKIVDNGAWYGNGGVIIDTNESSGSGWEMTESAGNCTLLTTGGTYTFQYNPTTRELLVLFDGESNVELPTYTVTFKDWDGTVLDTQTVEIGSAATAPRNPSRSGYKFTGWDADFGYVTSDMTVTAQYKDNRVYLMGINGNWDPGIRMSYVSGSTYKATIKLGAGYHNFKIKHGDNWYGNNGCIEDTTDYTSATGWGMDPFAGDCTLNAIGSTYTFTFNTSTRMLKVTYIAPIYTVTFKDHSGNTLSTQSVKRGDAAEPPAIPVKEGSIFIGWDRDYSWIYEDMVITAMYADNNINLMGDFNSWSGTTMTHQHGSIFAATVELAPGSYGFKVKIGESWLGNSGTVEDTTTTTSETGWEMSSAVGDNCTLKATGGLYTFAYNVQTKMLIITYLGSGEGLDGISLMGSFNEWAGTEMTNDGESTVYSTVVELEAGTHSFKVVNGLTWFGYNGTIEDTTSTISETGIEMSVEAGDCVLKATGGLYLFIFDTATNMLMVKYGDEASGDEATPDEATTDEATPDELTHEIIFNQSENFTIVTDSDLTAIEDGASLSFTVVVQEGYKLIAVVHNMTILSAVDGVYTIENITSDTPIIVVVEKDETVSALPEFTVTFTDKDGNVLKTENVQYGEAATAPEAPEVEGYEFKGWNTEFDYVTMDITVKATYKKIVAPVAPSTTGVIKIEVAGGGTGFMISVDGAAARPQGASYLNTKAPKGAVVTVTANEVAGATFIGWMNPVSGVILTTDYAYTFVSSGNDFFRAMYVVEVEGVQMVTFKNDKANRVLDAQYYAESDEIVFPEAPTQVGFDFAGWNMTEAEIKAAIAAGKDVTVLATWTKAVVPVQVTVNGGTGTGTYPANNQVTVVANAPEAGQKFAYWVDGDGNVKSYNAEYSFFPSGDVELTAVFVAEDAEIEYQILVNLDSIDFESQAATNKAVFTYSWYCPEGYTFVKAGLVAVNKDNFNEATFVAGTTDSNVYDRSPNSANNISVNTYTWTKSSVMSGQTWVARAYVQFRDANGQVQTVYSDIVEATKE